MSSISDMAAFQKELTDLETLYQETTGQPLSKFYARLRENTVWRI